MSPPRIDRPAGPGLWLWISFVVIASLALSRAFACATPFAGVAVAAAVTLPRRHAAALVVLVWFGHQAIGFELMHYPQTISTFGWGGAIGLAALAALAAAATASRLMKQGVIAGATALMTAYAAYEAVLFAATAVLPSGSGAFTMAVVMRIFAINAVAFGLLLAAHRLADKVAVHGHQSASALRG